MLGEYEISENNDGPAVVGPALGGGGGLYVQNEMRELWATRKDQQDKIKKLHVEPNQHVLDVRLSNGLDESLYEQRSPPV